MSTVSWDALRHLLRMLDSCQDRLESFNLGDRDEIVDARDVLSRMAEIFEEAVGLTEEGKTALDEIDFEDSDEEED